eukprot:1890606-Amphidinium_carterae.1
MAHRKGHVESMQVRPGAALGERDDPFEDAGSGGSSSRNSMMRPLAYPTMSRCPSQAGCLHPVSRTSVVQTIFRYTPVRSCSLQAIVDSSSRDCASQKRNNFALCMVPQDDWM